MQYLSDQEAKTMIIAVGKRMYEKNYVVSNDGNLSIKVGDDAIWTTPTGVCKYDMTEDMLVKVDLNGNRLAGNAKASSELKMHLRVYRENPQTKAIVHAHPPIATSFATAGIPLDQPILAEAILKLGKVPLAPYATIGTQEVPDAVAPYCRDYCSILLANHGVLCWAEDLWEAYYLMETTEQYAKITLLTQLLGNRNLLTEEQTEKIRMQRK